MRYGVVGDRMGMSSSYVMMSSRPQVINVVSHHRGFIYYSLVSYNKVIFKMEILNTHLYSLILLFLLFFIRTVKSAHYHPFLNDLRVYTN